MGVTGSPATPLITRVGDEHERDTQATEAT